MARRKAPVPPLEAYDAIGAFKAGRVEEAERLLRRAFTKAPGDREVNHLLALALLQLGRAPEAEYFAGRAIEIVATVPEFHNTMGRALSAQKRHPAAAAAFAKAIALRPQWAEALANLAQEQLRLGLGEEAKAQDLRDPSATGSAPSPTVGTKSP